MHTHNASRRSSTTPIASDPCPLPEAWPRPLIILEHVAMTYALTVQRLQAKGRGALIVEARQVAIHLLAASGRGPSGIARLLRLNHSTVSHHLRHARLDQLQQQMIAELTTELHRMAERPRTLHWLPTSDPRLPDGKCPAPARRSLTQDTPSLGEHSDRLLVIHMPCP